MKNRRIIAMLTLSSVALIWGTSFVAQILGMEYIGPFTFCAVRYCIATLFIIPFAVIIDKERAGAYPDDGTFISDWRSCAGPGAVCGAVLFTANALQQSGLLFTSAGKAAFITTMYIVIVPLFGILSKKTPPKPTLLAVAASSVGLYLLSINENFTIEAGDALILAATFFWALHIIVCGHFAKKYDTLKLSAIQFTAVAFFAAVAMFTFEQPRWSEIIASWKPLAYAGIFGTCVAYTLQMMAQRHVPPVPTCIILSSEALFAALSGFLFLGESLSAREMTGCAILLASTLTAQIQEAKS
ncbi:MAG: DMT family transporter [Synergistes jonesii]|uniref:DMT family transporter n=1 Tax=Synergistes jonesii TaxID=2754 RepID=UPI002A747BDE|nr:DMT family transporter [Synergistes jonesii]MDY2985117.1 DMT family transporter [Synergistes jonesii]